MVGSSLQIGGLLMAGWTIERRGIMYMTIGMMGGFGIGLAVRIYMKLFAIESSNYEDYMESLSL